MYQPVDGGTPARPLRGPMPPHDSWARWPVSPRPGFYPWPVWGPLPEALPPGGWALGLVTGVAGALAGGWGLRLVATIVRRGLGREAVPAAASDLAMIAGAFLGWQPVLVAIVLALAAAAPLYLRRLAPPFGLFLALAVVAAWLGWAWIGPAVRPMLFSPTLLPPLIAASLALIGVVALLVRVSAAPAPSHRSV
jgi:hypothetical protein